MTNPMADYEQEPPMPRRTPTRIVTLPTYGLYDLRPEGLRTLRWMIAQHHRRRRVLETQIQQLWATIDESRATIEQLKARLIIEQFGKTAPHKASRRRRDRSGTPSRSVSPT